MKIPSGKSFCQRGGVQHPDYFVQRVHSFADVSEHKRRNRVCCTLCSAAGNCHISGSAFYGKTNRRNGACNRSPGIPLLLLITAVLINTVFKFYMVDHMLGVETKEIFVAWKTFSMVACLLLLMVQFGTLKRNSISVQKQQLEDLLYQKQQQYELSRKI